MGAAARLRLALFAAGAAAWNVCDVADHGAVGDGQTDDSRALRSALAACDEVVIPRHRSCVSGPLNLTSNQVLRVDGALLASTIPAQYPLMEPVVGYGWSRDTNCFPANSTRRGFREGARRHAPVVGAYNASNVSVVGGGVIDGRAGEPLGWWDNCTRCRGARPPDPAFPPDEAFCLAASRPKLLEFQYVTGLTVAGNAVGDPLHLKDSPFWTLTPSYSRNVRVRDLRITAPIRTPGIGNTDGVNLDSCRDALAAPGAPPRKRTLPKLFAHDRVGDDAGRGGFAVGSEMSGGVRNVTFRDSVLGAGPQSRGIDVKTSVGRGGYIIDVTFENIRAPSPFPKANVNVHSALRDDPDVPGDDLVPVIGNLRFANVSGPSGCGFSFCDKANGSACYNLVVEGDRPDGCVAPDPGPPLPAMSFSCKRVARTLFGEITLPWPVCVPRRRP
ncbi:glycosyl hydrolase [Aureococcus anophagefferens]|nr:glycosyl hydrolase [Aureococcus anophagefferens]